MLIKGTILLSPQLRVLLKVRLEIENGSYITLLQEPSLAAFLMMLSLMKSKLTLKLAVSNLNSKVKS